MDFWNCHVIQYGHSIEHAKYLREIIIFISTVWILFFQRQSCNFENKMKLTFIPSIDFSKKKKKKKKNLGEENFQVLANQQIFYFF